MNHRNAHICRHHVSISSTALYVFSISKWLVNCKSALLLSFVVSTCLAYRFLKKSCFAKPINEDLTKLTTWNRGVFLWTNVVKMFHNCPQPRVQCIVWPPLAMMMFTGGRMSQPLRKSDNTLFQWHNSSFHLSFSHINQNTSAKCTSTHNQFEFVCLYIYRV